MWKANIKWNRNHNEVFLCAFKCVWGKFEALSETFRPWQIEFAQLLEEKTEQTTLKTVMQLNLQLTWTWKAREPSF